MSRHFDLIHNTDQWYDARAGLATTSCFDKIITPSASKTKKFEEFSPYLSAQADFYADTVIAELMLGRPIERNFDTYALEWGRQHEADAANLYMFDTGLDVIHGGFFTNDELTQGTSPDVIVLDGDKQVGIAEIKCPENPAVHVQFLLQKEINKTYKPQIFGQMLVTGFEWVDWFSYYPGMPANRIRTHLSDDPDFVEKMKDALAGFEKLLQSKLERLRELGHIDEIPKKMIRETRKAAHEPVSADYMMAG